MSASAVSSSLSELKELHSEYAPLLEPLNVKEQLYCGQIVDAAAAKLEQEVADGDKTKGGRAENLASMQREYAALKDTYLKEAAKRNAVEMLVGRSPLENVDDNTKLAREDVVKATEELASISGTCNELSATVRKTATAVSRGIVKYVEAQASLRTLLNKAANAENEFVNGIISKRSALQTKLDERKSAAAELEASISAARASNAEKRRRIDESSSSKSTQVGNCATPSKDSAEKQMQGMVKWTDQMVSFLGKLAGVRLESIESNSVVAKLSVDVYAESKPRDFRIVMHFTESSGKLESAFLKRKTDSSSDEDPDLDAALASAINFERIVQSAVSINDLNFLLRQTRVMLYNHFALQSELSELRLTHPVSFSERLREVVVTLSHGIIATLELPANYTKDFDAVKLRSLDGFVEGWHRDTIDEIKAQVDEQQFVSIVSLAGALMDAIKSRTTDSVELS